MVKLKHTADSVTIFGTTPIIGDDRAEKAGLWDYFRALNTSGGRGRRFIDPFAMSEGSVDI